MTHQPGGEPPHRPDFGGEDELDLEADPDADLVADLEADLEGDVEGCLEERVRRLESQLMTLTAAVDAASRLRISTLRINPDIRIAGGKKVRRILERGDLVRGYPETPGAG